MSEREDLVELRPVPRWEWALEVIVCPALIGLCLALIVVGVAS